MSPPQVESASQNHLPTMASHSKIKNLISIHSFSPWSRGLGLGAGSRGQGVHSCLHRDMVAVSFHGCSELQAVVALKVPPSPFLSFFKPVPIVLQVDFYKSLSY